MLALIPLFPFAGFLVNAAFGRVLPKRVSGTLACLAIGASFVVSVMVAAGFIGGHAEPVQQNLYTWIPSGDLQVPLGLRVDPLAALMILIITGIGSLIHIYSVGYMNDERPSEYARYFSYLNLFASFMLVLVLGASFPVMFVGWEGVGLCSYLLIGFWFTKQSAADAGKKAFVVNRVGDFGFILGMLLIFVTFNTLDFQQVAVAVSRLAPETAGAGVITVATLLLFLGAAGKSAQIPLYIWLPDAMEGPTPVSALIHAATMVTAGVYLIGRNAELFAHAPITLAVVAGIGVATALMAGTIGLVQNDIKRVLAYSTVSQLGLMFLAMGVGAYAAGIFHLYTHAFFKALLFLGSGAVIHALAGEQDLRNMGGLKKYLPITYWTFLIGALAIAGVPLLSGFFSKDELLFRTFTAERTPGHTLMWTLGILTSLLTAIYMFRLVFLAFHGERRVAAVPPEHPEEEEPPASDLDRGVHGVPTSRGSHGADTGRGSHGSHAGHGSHGSHGHGAPHDAPPSMAIPLVVLAIGSILAGYAGVPHALGGSNWIERFLHPSFEAHAAPSTGTAAVTGARESAEILPQPAAAAEDDHASASTELMLMAVSSGIALAGIAIAAYFWLRNRPAADALAARFAGAHRLLYNKYYVDEVYDAVIVQPIKQVSAKALWRGADAGLIDGAVNGVGVSIREASNAARRVQTGSVRTYAAALFVGAVLVIGYYLVS
jgi:NADH-quinone oxidoreductase subunit L